VCVVVVGGAFKMVLTSVTHVNGVVFYIGT